jgi:hypothetical protein
MDSDDANSNDTGDMKSLDNYDHNYNDNDSGEMRKSLQGVTTVLIGGGGGGRKEESAMGRRQRRHRVT